MIVANIEGVTAVIGKSQGFKGLPIRHEVKDGVSYITTAWEPTPAEIKALTSGATIHITLMAQQHPPIYVGVGNKPEG